MTTKFLRLLPVAAVMGTIFLLSHQPGDRFDLPLFFGADKVAHAGVYGVLAGTVLAAFSPARRAALGGRAAVAAFIVAVLFGISDEFHQAFIPGRFPSLLDLAADGLGAAAVCLLWFFIDRRLRQRNSA